MEEYSYFLPPARIANYPLAERDASRLLIYNGAIRQNTFYHLADYLEAGSTIVFNNSRVVEARLQFRKPTGAGIEIFCLEPGSDQGDVTEAFAQTARVVWKCMIGNASAWPTHQVLSKQLENCVLEARQLKKEREHYLVELSWSKTDMTFAELLHHAGVMPLPPYIKRQTESLDEQRYQTIYAEPPGSVAAPTAGLHFTDRVMRSLEKKSICPGFVTLHVGAGTFKPVKSETLKGHEMHSESIEVHRDLIQHLIDAVGKPTIAVGTTSLRTLESLYWIGKKLNSRPSPTEIPVVDQWTAYDDGEEISALVALQAIKKWMEVNDKDTLVTKTSLLIAPGYRFRVVDTLVTNLHQPGSTLLLLIAAFIGDDWKSVYTYALENDFRFLSYGDSCLLFRQ